MTGTIRHHLSDALLTGYAVGSLPEAFSLVAATHVSLCDECRARLAVLEHLGGALIDDHPAVAMADGALDRVLARLGSAEPRPVPPTGSAKVLPEPLRAYVGGDISSVRWKSVALGVRQAMLPTGAGATARLLSIPAGRAIPSHTHRGIELTLVLQGAFSDHTDRFGPGDLEISDQDLRHSPVADPGQDCICLAATEAPLRFTGLLPRLFQTILRI